MRNLGVDHSVRPFIIGCPLRLGGRVDEPEDFFVESRCLGCKLPVVLVDIEQAPPALARSPRPPLRRSLQ